jgi:2Fe-2S ferredoxin
VKHKVTFLPSNRTVEVDENDLPYGDHGKPGSILDIALAHGIHLEHNCGGSCACTTCHLIIKQGMQNLSDMEDNEADRLDTAWDLTTSSRLGCQAVVKGDVVAQFPMYTRNYVQEGGGIQLGNPNPSDRDKEGEVRP